MNEISLQGLWLPTGILMGFQVTLFKMRLEREISVGDLRPAMPTWLTPSDYVGIVGVLSYLFGVILLPLAGWFSTALPSYAFGFGSLMFIGQLLGLAGHYELFNHRTIRRPMFCPRQEFVIVAITALLGLAYILVAIGRPDTAS